jgi:hypothetical protein
MTALYTHTKKRQALLSRGLSHRGTHEAQNLSLRRLQKRVRRADLRAAAPNPQRLELQVWPASLASVGSDWPILRDVPAEACAHGYGKRASDVRPSHTSPCLISPLSLRARSLTFSRISSVAGSLRAQSAGNPGEEPATDEAGDYRPPVFCPDSLRGQKRAFPPRRVCAGAVTLLEYEG